MAEIHKPEVIGVNVIQAMQTARARVAPTTTYPPLKDALPAWLDAQERKGDPLSHRQIRYRTVNMYGWRPKGRVY